MPIVESGVVSAKAMLEGPKCPRCADWTTLQSGRELVGFKKVLDRVRGIVKRS